MANHGETSIIQALRDALLQFAVKSKKLASPMLAPFGRSAEPVTVDSDELTALKSKLLRIRAALRNAECLSINDHSVRLWLSELGDLEHRAEDVLEELEYESRRAEQLEELKIDLLCAATTVKRRREVALLFAAAPARRLRRKIDDIWARYEEISSDRKKLRLRPGDGVPRPAPGAVLPTSALTLGQLYGRDRDIEKVAAVVLGQHDGGRNYAVVPIVGMAGVGKTALVQHVCDTEAVKLHFEMTFWIWVSQEVDVIGATRKIVEAITRFRPECGELSTLHELIVESLAGKRCLIVLDDVWDDNPSCWDILMAPLSCCAPGSTIVVTTRSWKVAKMVNPKVYHLKCLSDESCWLVCRQRALPRRSSSHTDDGLVGIGENIAKKCGGLPLAAVAVGTALNTSISPKHWNEVLESDLWADNEVKSLVLPALKVSYDHLLNPLKHCFAVCALFPKGFVFDKDVLIQLWMALGFLDAQGECTPEVTGNGYFNDLVSRCFFHPSPCHDDSEGKFIMHDLYQELAQFVSGSECRMVKNNYLTTIDDCPRHLSYVTEEFHSSKELHLNSTDGYRDLRSFLFLARTKQNHDEIPCRAKIPTGLVTYFECIRVLDLSNTNILELPKSIGNLIHLRYLSLENTSIQMLPESICALFHLQTIKLNNCSSLTQLPQGIKLLQNLRCLEIPHSNIRMPSGIGELTRLQRLPLFTVRSESAVCDIEKLNDLVNLRGQLHIIGLNNLDIAHAMTASLSNKLGIQKLTLEWSETTKFSNNNSGPEGNVVNVIAKSSTPVFSIPADQVLKCLKPHPNLEEVSIKGYNGSFFHTWLEWPPLDKLSCIELKDCNSCEELPPLGSLPSLKHILIQSLPNIRIVGPEFFGDVGDIASSGSSKVGSVFPALESLTFRNMEAWEEWSGVRSDHLLNLKYLGIAKCRKLKLLPRFTSEPELRIRHCDLLQMRLCQVPFETANDCHKLMWAGIQDKRRQTF